MWPPSGSVSSSTRCPRSGSASSSSSSSRRTSGSSRSCPRATSSRIPSRRIRGSCSSEASNTGSSRPPMVTVIALNLGFVLGGAIQVEAIFSYDGLGLLTITAILDLDYPLLQGLFLLITITVVVANLISDFVYAWLDPRVRLERGEDSCGGPGGQARARPPTARRPCRNPSTFCGCGSSGSDGGGSDGSSEGLASACSGSSSSWCSSACPRALPS